MDESDSFQRIEYPYECSNSEGGLLTLIKDGEKIKGIRFATSGESKSEFFALYYKKQELVFIVHEKGEWFVDQEQDIQTVFYLDKGQVIRCMRKIAKGKTAEMEQLIKSAKFDIIQTDKQLLEKLKKYENVFIDKPSEQKIVHLFCP